MCMLLLLLMYTVHRLNSSDLGYNILLALSVEPTSVRHTSQLSSSKLIMMDTSNLIDHCLLIFTAQHTVRKRMVYSMDMHFVVYIRVLRATRIYEQEVRLSVPMSRVHRYFVETAKVIIELFIICRYLRLQSCIVHIRWRPNKHSFKRPHISTLFIKTVVECNDGWCTHNSVRKIVPDIVLSVGPVRPSVSPSYKKLEIRADPKLYFLSLSVRCYVTADCRRSRTSSWSHIIFLSHARCSFISYISYCICLSVCVANKLHHKMRNAIA